MVMGRITRSVAVCVLVFAYAIAVPATPADADALQQACTGDLRAPPPITPDVETGSKASTHDQKIVDTLNEKPPGRLTYIGTVGFLTQRMEAIPRTPRCPLGAAVVLSRPPGNADRRYNTDCCPPGLRFAASNSVRIVGAPTRPGQLTKTILLCGYCKGSSTPNFTYPIRATIRWEIKGRKPKRID